MLGIGYICFYVFENIVVDGVSVFEVVKFG